MPVLWETNGHYYQRVDVGGISWSAAKAAAAALSYQGTAGHLVTITSPEENLFLTLHAQLGGGTANDRLNRHWLGAYQPPGTAEPSAGWRWITGEAFTYWNWASGEPNDFSGTAEDRLAYDHVFSASGKQWNDATDGWSTSLGYVVEFDVPVADQPPEIVTQPPAEVRTPVGSELSLQVVARGTPVLIYRWYHDGLLHSEAATNLLRVPQAQLADAGNYFVVVTNSLGSATSRVARVVVGYPLTVSTNGVGTVQVNPRLQVYEPGQMVELTAVPGGTRAFLGWSGDASGTGNPLQLTMDAPKRVEARFSLDPPTILVEPLSQSVAAGSTVRFSVEAQGTPPLFYQWFFNGAAVEGGTQAALVLTNVSTLAAGHYQVAVSNQVDLVLSQVAELTVQPNLIVNGDFSLSVPSNGAGNGWASSTIDFAGGWRSTGGRPAGFFILNDSGGALDPTISQIVVGLTPGAVYQVEGDFRTVYIGYDTGSKKAFGAAVDGVWQYESPGVRDTGWRHFRFEFEAKSTSARLSLAAERNGTDNDFGIDNITLVPLTQAPELRRSPGWLVFLEGMEGQIKVWVTGVPEPQVQWYYAGSPVVGATNTTLALPAVTRALEGIYWLVASNVAGQATSAPIAVVVSNVDPERFVAFQWAGRTEGGLTLESADRLGAAAAWQTLSNYPPAAAEQRWVEFEPAAAGAAQFYRLSGSGSPPLFTGAGWVNGLRFDAVAGSRHQIEYVAEATGWTNWQALTNLVLPASPYLFLDYDSLNVPVRVYRTTPAP